MILPGDNKKAASLIMRRMKGSDSYNVEKAPTNEMGDEVDYGMGLESAAEEMIIAMERKDPKGFKTALKSFIEMCMDEEENYEDEEKE